MAHVHGSEYQLKIVYEDGTEELSGWMPSQEQVAKALKTLPKRRDGKCWLRERSRQCPACSPREQNIAEFPFADFGSPRYSPRDSQYLVAVGSKDRCEVFAITAHGR